MEKNTQTNQEYEDYRSKMEFPMENLAIALFGFNSDVGPYPDHELVEIAAKKINMLKAMLLASGFNEKMLKACLEN